MLCNSEHVFISSANQAWMVVKITLDTTEPYKRNRCIQEAVYGSRCRNSICTMCLWIDLDK